LPFQQPSRKLNQQTPIRQRRKPASQGGGVLDVLDQITVEPIAPPRFGAIEKKLLRMLPVFPAISACSDETQRGGLRPNISHS